MAWVRREKGLLLGGIGGFYRAFGFTIRDVAGETFDHLRCELEFLAALLVMEATALRSGHAEHAEITGRAIVTFAIEHAGGVDSIVLRDVLGYHHPGRVPRCGATSGRGLEELLRGDRRPDGRHHRRGARAGSTRPGASDLRDGVGRMKSLSRTIGRRAEFAAMADVELYPALELVRSRSAARPSSSLLRS